MSQRGIFRGESVGVSMPCTRSDVHVATGLCLCLVVNSTNAALGGTSTRVRGPTGRCRDGVDDVSHQPFRHYNVILVAWRPHMAVF